MVALFVLGGIGTLVVAAAQTPVQEAKSNLSGWLTEIGFGQLPYWLTTLAADNWATLGGLTLLCASGFSIFFLGKKRSNRITPTVAASINSDIVTAKRNMLSGDKLVDWGINLFIYGGILAGGVMLSGLLLVVIGQSLSTKHASEETKEISKAPTDAPAPPPILKKPIAEAPIDPPQAPATTPPARVFVDKDVTPEFLVGLYEGQTSLGGKTRVSKYLGKWMDVPGSLGEVYGAFTDGAPAVAGITSPKGTFIITVFNGERIREIAEIAKGDNILVRGKISEVLKEKLTLDDCELVKPSTTPGVSQPAPSVPPDQPDQ